MSRKVKKARAVIAAAALGSIVALAACGGGGGGDASASSSPAASSSTTLSATVPAAASAAAASAAAASDAGTANAVAVKKGSPDATLSTNPAPTIVNAPTSARAGDIVALQGAYFGSAPSVFLDSPGANPLQLSVVDQSVADSVTVQLPAAISGAIKLRVVNNGVSSPVALLNAARPYHLDTFDIVPGGTFRIFGRSLKLTGSTPLVTVDGLPATVNVAASDEHMLVVTAPPSLRANIRILVTVDNGNGSGPATMDRPAQAIASKGTDPFGIDVGWVANFGEFASRVINASQDTRLPTKVICNGVQDDTVAIQSAIDAAAGGTGGVVQLPAGACRVTASIQLKSKVILQGAGKDATVLRYEADYPLYIVGTDFVAVRNLSLTNSGRAQQAPVFKANTHLVLQNLRLNLGTSYQVFAMDNKNLVVTGCDFVQGNGISDQGPYVFHRSSGMVFSNNTTTWVTGAPSFGSTHDAYFAGNRFTRNATSQVAAVVHSFAIDFAYRIAVVGNTFDVIGGPITNKARNDGEALLTEGGSIYGNTENVGTVSSATATTLSDPGNSINTDPFNTGSIPENYGVAIVAGKGTGQTRRVTGYASNTLTVDRAWDVIPDATSKYATFVWGLEKSLIKGNTLSQNPRGIWLYQTAVREVDIVGNTITEGGGIYLRPAQNLADKRFDPIYNVKIVGNTISNTRSNWGSYVSVYFVNMDARAFGVATIGIEVRDNQLTANRPNLVSPNEDYVRQEGFMNMMLVENYDRYETMSLPRLLSTVFQGNACTYCDVAFRLGTGAGGTVISGTTMNSSQSLWTNSRTTISPEMAINTSVH